MIYAFEPEYSNLHQLKQNIINNNLFENVIPFSLAISDQIGVSYLHIQDFTPGAALSTESSDALTKTFDKDALLYQKKMLKLRGGAEAGVFTNGMLFKEVGLDV